MTESKQTRFAELSDTEKTIILENVEAKNTKKATSTAIRVLREYLSQKGKTIEFENLTPEDLDAILSEFYLEARTEKGEKYKKSTLMAYRHGIQRYIEKTRPDIDIIRGADFKTSSKTFKAMGKELKRTGFGEVNHHAPIADADLIKLYDYVCSDDSPVFLQYKVFLDIMLHFGRRGRENLAALRVTDLAVTTDAEGDMFVYMCTDEQTKNHQDDGDRARGRMYEKKDNTRCPVRSYVKYIRLLNKNCPKLFQQPNTKMEYNQHYYPIALGHNRIGSMMPNLSIKAGLSMKYTNHSLRATTVHVLDAAQVPSRHIMTVTGHKSESSLKTYTGYTDEKAKKKMSATIAEKTCDAAAPVDDINNFLNDVDFDRLLETIDVHETTDSAIKPNVQMQSSMVHNCLTRMPGPVMHGCNVTINYNFYQHQ
ncbi:uncharacterized protein [Haliotis asinina]|uniref:uncharacterized protein n=1 Tax=Haliotis asinina TaxID=109174 RepID=UPI003531D022